MRGARISRIRSSRSPRFIPAHAGSTTTRLVHLTYQTVHPRACGEHRNVHDFLKHFAGSSPRMRGAPAPSRRTDRWYRFIPAHAGSTYRYPDGIANRPVHPRACGEHLPPLMMRNRSFGSSPRMRGAPVHTGTGKDGVRFIPAHAGSTRLRTCHLPACPVHPRACGEHRNAGMIASAVFGSSPRMRGALDAAVLYPERDRFIPAHAGSTPVHSIPGMRGARPRMGRFIPAHAGSTDAWEAHREQEAVHPRACGEHQRTNILTGHRAQGRFIPAHAGSTIMPVLPACVQRFIPAHAGSTRAADWIRFGIGDRRFIPAHAGSTPFVTPCGPRCYRPRKSVPILGGKINTTLHLPLARRIQGAGRPDLQVSCDSCQRFQIRNPHHWGKSRR